MKQQTTYMKIKSIGILSCLFLLLLGSSMVYGQTKVLANEVTFETGRKPLGWIPRSATVENSGHALTDGNDDYARILASPGVLLGGGAYVGELELKFPSELPAGQWSYVRINADDSLLRVLLGGSLGSSLGTIVGGLLLGNQEFEVNVLNGSASVLKRNNTQNFDTDNVKLLVDGNGHSYIAVKPSLPYDRIRLTNRSISLIGLGTTYHLDVYNAFTYNDTGGNCGRPIGTSFDGTGGLSLNLLPTDMNTTLGKAIDNDLTTFSTLKSSDVLGVSVAGSISQNFYFSTPTDAASTVNVKLGLPATGVLDLKVLSGIDIIFKNNGQEVATRNVTSGLLAGTDVLGLLQSNDPPPLTFGLGIAFDQIEIRSSALVGLGLLGSPDVRIYDVQRYDGSSPQCTNPNITVPTPTPPMLSHKNCGGTLIAHEHANFPANVVDGNNDTFTTLEASSGIIANAGGYSGFVEMGIAVPAKKTTYVRIDFDNEVLGGLLNGSVGGLLNGVVSNLLFGGHYFTIEGKNGGTTVFSRSSNDGLASGTGAGTAKIIQDKNGHYYIAITPDSAITSVRITEKLSGLLGLGTVKTMKVYHACYSTSSNACEQSFATYSTSDGITLDLLGLGAAGVVDAQNAIDGDIATASKVSVGAVGVAGSMMQHVQFHGLSTDRDHFRVKMKMQSSGVVSADLIGSIMIEAYNGDTKVFSQRLNEQLIPGIDLLNLLSTGQMINIPFAPGKAFDRVAVGISSLVAANVISAPLEIYSIERFNTTTCIDPELQWDPKTTSPFNTPACGVNLGRFENVNFPYEAVTDNPGWDTYATVTAGAGLVGGLGAYSGHLELMYSGSGAAAHEVSYIRIDSESNLFDALLGGSLGDALGGILGTVALGDQYIVVQALNAAGAPIGAAYDSRVGFNTEFARLVKDVNGRFYLAVTAPLAYQGVRIEYHHKAIVGVSGSSSLKVYSMCRETVADVCEQATFTSWESSGIALDLLNLADGGVVNSEFAIDDNSSNYSTLNVGAVGAAASVSQRVYFKTKSSQADALRVRLQLASPGILNVDLFGNSKLIFYNGEQMVKEMTLASGLINNLDLLGLLNSGGIQSFTFTPNVVFDRVELKIATLVAVGTSAPVRLYAMTRLSEDCPDPGFLDPGDVFKSPVCADGFEIGTVKAVDDVDFAIDGDYNSYARMRADAGILLGIGNQPSVLELKFGSSVPANTTSYLRVGDDKGVLASLLSGSLGEAVYGLVNQIALGNNYFVVRAKDGSNEVLVGSSKDGFAQANGLMKIVQDKTGRYFVAISPKFDYSSVEIKVFSESIVGVTSQPYDLHVYGMCYETDFSGCEEGFSTSWDGSGISVGITGVGSYGVTDAFKALNDNNNGDYSTLSLGTLNVAGHIQQNVQYNKAVPANTSFRLKMGLGNGTVNASVFDNVRIIGYKDGVEVYNKELQTAVLGGVSLGTLFSNGGDHDVNFAMDKEVDEVALRLNSLVNATVAIPDVRLYYIVQDCATPEFVSWKSANQTSVQGGEEIEYTIHVRNTGTVNVVDAIIKDKIPFHTTYVTGSGGVLDADIVSFPALDVLVGETKTVTFRVKVDRNLTGVTEIYNIATVNGEATFPPLPNNSNEPDITALPGTKVPVEQVRSVVSWKAYTINTSKTATTVSGGEDVTYHIYVRNTGNQNLTNISISDVLPAGMVWKNGGTHLAGTVTFTIPSLAVGATSSALNFVVTVKKDLTGITIIKNIALVKTDATDPGVESFAPVDNTNPTEPNPTTPGTIITVAPNHDIDVSKLGISNNANTGQAHLGDQITYTITVKNTGNKALSNVVVKDAIPNNLAITNNGGGTVSGNTITFTILNLAVDEVKDFTIIATVGNVAGVNEIVNTAEVTYRNEDNTADKIENATHRMPTSCVPISITDFSLSTTNTSVCEGVSFTMNASTTLSLTNAVYKWYTNASLTGTPLMGDVITTNVLETTTFYVTLEANGYCTSTPPKTITITVMPKADIPTITVTGGETSVCEGNSVIVTATETSANATSYQWFKNGVAIVGAINPTYAVTETGNYSVAALNASGCYTDQSASTAITILPLPLKPIITPNGNYQICEGELVSLTASQAVSYEWYLDGNIIQFPSNADPLVMVTRTNRQTINVNGAGSYTVKVFNSDECASVFSDPIIISVSPTPKLTVTGSQLIYVAKSATINWPTVTSDIGTVSWYFNGALVPSLPTSIATTGVYTYTAVGVSGNCYSTETIIVNVYDDEGCPPGVIRTYANSESWGSIITGGVSNRANAVNGDPKTYSTITTGVGLLGIGTTWQTLFFPQKVAAGTPVTIKLGKEYSGLAVAGGISVVGVYKDGLGTPIDIGVLKPVQGGLLDLLTADNVVEFTFVPSDVSGTKAYDGVRISVGALLSVAQSAKVYGAYITKPGSPSCAPIDSTTNANIIDVLHGVEDIGLGVASATASVVNPWNAVDNDLNSFALITRGVAVANRATLTAVFKQPTTKGDQLQIILEMPGNPILSLELIKGYTIQRFMGNQPVGPALDSESSILDLKLLGLLGGYSDRVKVLVAPFDEPYDRVKISYGSLVGVLGNATKIFDISIAPSLDYGAVNGDLTLCTTDSLVFKSTDDCTIYEVYTSETGTGKLKTTDGLSFELPKNLAVGKHTFYVQAIRAGCTIGPRQAIEITLEKCSKDCIISNPMLTNKIRK